MTVVAAVLVGWVVGTLVAVAAPSLMRRQPPLLPVVRPGCDLLVAPWVWLTAVEAVRDSIKAHGVDVSMRALEVRPVVAPIVPGAVAGPLSGAARKAAGDCLQEPMSVGVPAEDPAPHRRGRVRVLGCPALFDGAGDRVGGLRDAALELLVYLVVHRGGASAEAIRRDVYAAASPERAAERMATDLANLRERLRHAAGEDHRVNLVPRSGVGYRLTLDGFDVDWWGVQDDCRALNHRSAGAVEADGEEIERALYRLVDAFREGVLADGAGYEWLEGLQERSRRIAISAHRRLAAHVAHIDGPKAAALLDRACALDPYDEDLARRAAAAHRAHGDDDAASARLHALREALKELGEVPTTGSTAPTPKVRDRLSF